MKLIYSIKDVIKKSKSKYICWVHLFLYYPISLPMVYWLANHTKITPNQVTVFQFLLRLITIIPFFLGTERMLLIGGILFFLCAIIDVVDGRLARLTNRTSSLGAHMDPMLDVIGDFLCIFAIAYGQIILSGDYFYIMLGMFFAFMNIFISTENMHLQIVREQLLKKSDKNSGGSNNKFNENANDLQKNDWKNSLKSKVNKFQNEHGISLFSIDILDIRFLVLVVGPITGEVKLFFEVGLVLVLFKFTWEKVLQLYRKEPVYFN